MGFLFKKYINIFIYVSITDLYMRNGIFVFDTDFDQPEYQASQLAFHQQLPVV